MRFTDAGNEILCYGLAFENKHPIVTFTIGMEMIDAEKLLILSALGMVLFAGIYREIGGDSDATTLALLATTISII